MMQAFVPVAVYHLTASQTLSRQYSGALITNRGASGTIVVVLPPGEKGLRMRFLRVGANAMRIEPQATEQVEDVDGAALTAGNYQELGDDGAMLEYIHDGTNWMHVYERGTINNE